MVNGHPLVYLDTAATALRPVSVTRALVDYYQTDNANPGHGGTLHTLARRSGERYEAARRTAARFVNAADPAEIVWTRGTTDAINLVAAAWGSANLERGDEILTTVAEHYSNLLPWQHLARRTGAKLRHLDIHDSGRLRIEDLDRLLTSRTKLVAFSHVSNVLGLVVDAKPICRRAHQAGAVVLIDGAQSAPHLAIDVQNLECDFFAFSGHKMFGPMGMGVLWARRSILERMPPYQSGANMAHDADLESARYADLPFKFQAGTANVAGPVGLAAAIEFMAQAKRDGLEDHEKALGRHLVNRLSSIRRVNVAGSVRDEDRIPLITFSVDGVPAADIVMAMDAAGDRRPRRRHGRAAAAEAAGTDGSRPRVALRLQHHRRDRSVRRHTGGVPAEAGSTLSEPHPVTADREKWLILVQQLPASPSNARVKTWRRLQQLGAVALKNSVYVLPNSPAAREDFEWIKTEIIDLKGQAAILAANAPASEEQEIMASFRRLRGGGLFGAARRD